jgi:hypothetical protein
MSIKAKMPKRAGRIDGEIIACTPAGVASILKVDETYKEASISRTVAGLKDGAIIQRKQNGAPRVLKGEGLRGVWWAIHGVSYRGILYFIPIYSRPA